MNARDVAAEMTLLKKTRSNSIHPYFPPRRLSNVAVPVRNSKTYMYIMNTEIGFTG